MTYNKATGTNLINANSPNKDLAMEFVKLTNSPRLQ